MVCGYSAIYVCSDKGYYVESHRLNRRTDRQSWSWSLSLLWGRISMKEAAQSSIPIYLARKLFNLMENLNNSWTTWRASWGLQRTSAVRLGMRIRAVKRWKKCWKWQRNTSTNSFYMFCVDTYKTYKLSAQLSFVCSLHYNCAFVPAWPCNIPST